MDSNCMNLFKKECAELLQAQSLETLRCYGRFIGMQKPTALSKAALIEGIMATLCGEIPPARNLRGAPIKNHVVNEELIKKIELLKSKYENSNVEELNLYQDSLPLEVQNEQPAQTELPIQTKQPIQTEQPIQNTAQKNTNICFNLHVNFSDLSDEQKEALRAFLKTL